LRANTPFLHEKELTDEETKVWSKQNNEKNKKKDRPINDDKYFFQRYSQIDFVSYKDQKTKKILFLIIVSLYIILNWLPIIT